MAKSTKNKGGRPPVINEAELQKLEYAFSIGSSVNEALIHANVKKSTYHNYINKNPEFMDRIELLKETMPLKARIVVDSSLNDHDINTAKWLLERRKKAEFSTQQNIEQKTELDVKVSPKEMELDDLLAMRDILAKYEGDK